MAVKYHPMSYGLDDDVEVFMVDFIERLSTLLLIWRKVEKDVS